jgi:EAL domain-containing protein (putative c-di-GMP-specific phosphodiesterase class I)
VDLGHNLGLRVVAEGVEDKATLQHLAALGCDSMQGYYLSKPMPPAELAAWLATQPQPAASHD